MRSSSSAIFLILFATAVAVGTATAFVPTSAAAAAPPPSRPSLNAGNDDDAERMQRTAAADVDCDGEMAEGSGEGSTPMIATMMDKFRAFNPLSELADIFSNFDDVVDDFFNKRVSCICFFGMRYIFEGKWRLSTCCRHAFLTFSSFRCAANEIQKMGNGEVFYGKRKYKPSGRVSDEYNGGGFTDYRKIEAAREFRELRAAMREKAREEGDGGGK